DKDLLQTLAVIGKESADVMLSALLTSPAPATQSQGASRERSGGDIDVAERVRAPTSKHSSA
ncbi:hypothetical protein, partial [Candidatus Binatus sp.]|uniref:hypothetical protein n=1 Tax=Candidatus Binatus sp. TaxID=2811406 RepID=UPI003C3F9C0B